MDFLRELRLIFKRLFRRITTLADKVTLVGNPSSFLLQNFVLNPQIKQ